MVIDGAGHAALWDRPEATLGAIGSFLDAPHTPPDR
jgi:hypothetical protein